MYKWTTSFDFTSPAKSFVYLAWKKNSSHLYGKFQWVIPGKIHTPPPDGWGSFLTPLLSPGFSAAQDTPPPPPFSSYSPKPPPSTFISQNHKTNYINTIN